MDYIHYQVEDFVDDPFFNKWVRQPGQDTDAFWKTWLENHPEKYEKVEEARRIVSFLSFQVTLPSDQEQEEVKKNIKKMIDALQHHNALHPLQDSKWTTINWRRVAAAFALLLVATLLVWHVMDYFQPQKYTTTYAEMQEIILPDSSIVTLNANSVLSYRKNWSENSDREVWLKGEAFFQVLKKPGQANARFIVHTHNLNVEVLGTEFNVNSRHGDTKVVLNSGKVKLNGKDERGQEQELLMEPGDLVLLTKEHELVRRQVNANAYSSWKDNRLFFDDMTIREVLQLLEDNYGYAAQVSDPSLLDMSFTGSCPADSIQILLTALEETFDIKVSVVDNTIMIQKKTQLDK